MNKNLLFNLLIHLLFYPVCFGQNVFNNRLEVLQQQKTQEYSNETVLVKGVIVDENNLPLEYVTIDIKLIPSFSLYKRFISNEKGEFEIKLPINAEYSIMPIFLGYKSNPQILKVLTEDINLNIIQMEISYKQLQEVAVRPLIIINPSEIIYNITSDPDRETSTLLDMFDKMPLMSILPNGKLIVDEENKTFIILRNGRPDALLNKGSVPYEEIIKRLPAMGFTQIRLITNPPSKYADYDYVISIEADKTISLVGIAGNARADYKAGERRTDLKTGFVGSAYNFRFSGGVQYDYFNSPTNTSELERNYYTNNNILSQINKTFEDGNKYNGNILFSQDIIEKQFITGTFKYSSDKINKEDLTEGSTIIANNQIRRHIYNNLQEKSDNNYLGEISYQIDFNKPGRTFVSAYKFTHNSSGLQIEREQSNEINQLFNQSKKPGRADDRANYIMLNYTDAFGEKVEFEQQVGFLHNNYLQEKRSFEHIFDSEMENKKEYYKLEWYVRRLDGYTSINWKATNRFHLRGNLRWDYMANNSYIKAITGENPFERISQEGLLWMPQATGYFILKKKEKKENSLSGDSFKEAFNKIGEQSGIPPQLPKNMQFIPQDRISVSYELMQYRPSYYHLTNYIDDTNPNNIFTGNPNLKSEKIHNISFSYRSKKTLNTNFRYSTSRNKISTEWYLNENNQAVRSYSNAGNFNRFNIQFSKLFIIAKKHRLNGMISGSYSTTKIKENRSESYTFNSMFSYNTTIFKDKLSLASYMYYFENWSSGYNGFKNGFPFYLNINMDSNIKLKNSTIIYYGVAFTNVLNWKNRTKSFVNSALFEERVTTYVSNIPISVYISFNFGKFKAKPIRTTRKKANIEGFSTDI